MSSIVQITVATFGVGGVFVIGYRSFLLPDGMQKTKIQPDLICDLYLVLNIIRPDDFAYFGN